MKRTEFAEPAEESTIQARIDEILQHQSPIETEDIAAFLNEEAVLFPAQQKVFCQILMDQFKAGR
ncbi:MAG: hypothetical protein H8E10_07475 [Desulfobacterales bacterium]|nr:hypothetical protein [Desulfobacterales bacterium]